MRVTVQYPVHELLFEQKSLKKTLNCNPTLGAFKKNIEYVYMLENLLNIRYYKNCPRVGMVGVEVGREANHIKNQVV